VSISFCLIVDAGNPSNLMWIKWFRSRVGRSALAPARPAPYVAGATHRETDAPAPRRLPPSLPSFPASSGFACDVAFSLLQDMEAAGCPSQGRSMNKTPTRPNCRPKLFLPLFLAGAETALEPKAFPLSREQLRAAVAERIG
jgi:hypothetical protein